MRENREKRLPWSRPEIVDVDSELSDVELGGGQLSDAGGGGPVHDS